MEIATVRSRINSFSKAILPGVVSVVLVITAALNVPLSGISSFFPLFSVMAVFYWSAYCPALMPQWFVLLLGLFQDILYGMPPGITSLMLLFLLQTVRAQRRHMIKEPFPVMWLMFGISVTIFVMAQWALYCIYYWRLILSETIIVQLLISVALYPLIHKLFNSVHRISLKV